MPSPAKVAAATAPFAHLMGLPAVAAPGKPPAPAAAAPKPAAGAAVEADDDKQRDGESDDDYKKRKEKMKADAAEKQADDEAAAERAEAQMAAERAELNDGGAAAQARDRERARCRAIFECAAAGARPDMAATVAFDTRMTATEGIAMLESFSAGTPARAKGADLRSRLAAEPAPAVVLPGAEEQPKPDANDPKVTAAAIVAAAERARGGMVPAATTK